MRILACLLGSFLGTTIGMGAIWIIDTKIKTDKCKAIALAILLAVAIAILIIGLEV